MAARLDSKHHTFLQAVLNRGPLSEKSAMAMYKSLVKSNSGNGFVPFLGAINKELEFVQMEVKKVMNQYDGKEFYGIINTLASKEAKLGTKYSQPQILFFTAVMAAIVQDPSASGVITSTNAICLKLQGQGESQFPTADTQAAAAPVKMSMQQKEDALSLLASDQLLSLTTDGGVALGVKAFLELRTAFRNLEVPFCEICNEAAIKAQLCSTEGCSTRVHLYCVSRIHSQSRKQRPKCSGCGTLWEPPREEAISEEEEDYVIPIATQEEPVRKRSKRSQLRSKRGVVNVDDEEDEHIEAIGQEEENSTPDVSLRTRSRSTVTGRSRSDTVPDEEDEVTASERPLRKRRR